jgi:hypothetical protein
MKIMFLCVRDTGGTAYTLAHAINRVTPENQAINVVSVSTFIRYPVMVDFADYNRSKVREMIYNSDVIVFLDAVKPLYEALSLSKKALKGKKKILLQMGSLWRLGRDQVVKEADRFFGHGEYRIALGDPALFLPLDVQHPETGVTKHFDASDENEVSWLPPVRGFDEIDQMYGISKPDKVAVETFGVPRKRVIFVHAPTSETNKGSQIFYRAATHAQQVCPNMVFTTIKQVPWATTLNMIAKSDVLYDQAPPFPTTYGALSVEAAVFHLPSFSQVAPECRDFFYRHTGLKTPHIVFSDPEDLFNKTLAMASDEKLRHQFGEANYSYGRQVHDEKPVVQRLMDIIDKTP